MEVLHAANKRDGGLHVIPRHFDDFYVSTAWVSRAESELYIRSLYEIYIYIGTVSVSIQCFQP